MDKKESRRKAERLQREIKIENIKQKTIQKLLERPQKREKKIERKIEKKKKTPFLSYLYSDTKDKTFFHFRYFYK